MLLDLLRVCGSIGQQLVESDDQFIGLSCIALKSWVPDSFEVVDVICECSDFLSLVLDVVEILKRFVGFQCIVKRPRQLRLVQIQNLLLGYLENVTKRLNQILFLGMLQLEMLKQPFKLLFIASAYRADEALDYLAAIVGKHRELIRDHNSYLILKSISCK